MPWPRMWLVSMGAVFLLTGSACLRVKPEIDTAGPERDESDADADADSDADTDTDSDSDADSDADSGLLVDSGDFDFPVDSGLFDTDTDPLTDSGLFGDDSGDSGAAGDSGLFGGGDCTPLLSPLESGIHDCDGVCVPASWIGNGICDDGSTGANLACSAFMQDGNDCTVL